MILLRHKTGLVAAVAGILLAWPATAQMTYEMRQLYERIDQLESQISAMQRQGNTSAPATRPATPTTAPQSSTPPAGSVVQALSDRIDALDGQLRTLLNQQEEMQYQVKQLSTKLDKMSQDVDFRLSALEKGGGAAAAGAAAGAASGEKGPTPSAGASAPGLAPGEGNLGAMKAGNQPTQQQASVAKKLPPGNAQERYDFSYKLLLQGDYAGAESAFGEWIQAYPDDKLAGNAQYWLAETYYARRDYERAAANFLKGYQKYPKSPKAADSLVKLGMSLTNLNQKAEACKVFRQLNADFPNPPPSVKQLATAERARAGCSA